MKSDAKVEYSKTEYAKVKEYQGVGQFGHATEQYTVSIWFKNKLKNDARPIAAYLFSHAAIGEKSLPGDHIGIGGNHDKERTGKLFINNGNTDKKKSVAGKTVIPPETWNHVVFIREGKKVSLYLNGKLEIKDEIEPTFGESLDYCLGSRSEKFAPVEGHLAQFALFDRALTEAEVEQMQVASGEPFGIELPTPIGFAMGVRDKRKIVHCKIHINGEGSKLGAEVPRVSVELCTA